MTWWKKLYRDYEESRSPDDDFLGWFLRRKLGFWGKITVLAILWGIWIFLYLNIYLYVYVFYGLVVLAILTLVQRLRKGHQKKKGDF